MHVTKADLFLDLLRYFDRRRDLTNHACRNDVIIKNISATECQKQRDKSKLN